MTDKEIIELYWIRSENAISETDSKYGAYCRSISYNILSDSRDVEECVDDTYLNTWNAIPPRRPNILMAFLGKIIRNVSINLYKKNSAQKRKGNIMGVIDELDECVPDSRNTVDGMADRHLITECIESFLAKQPEVNADIFVRRYWYMDSIPKISTDFRMSQSKVTSILFRMRKGLKAELEEMGVEV